MSELKTMRSSELKDSLNKRMNRVIGQMNGIKTMIESDRYCGDILTQLAAVRKAIDSISDMVLDNHMHHCVKDAIKNDDNTKLDEVMTLIRRFR